MNKTVIWLVLGGVIFLLAVIVGGYVFSRTESAKTQSPTDTTLVPGEVDTTSSPIAGFKKILELKQNESDASAPYIAEPPCIVDGRFAYVLHYPFTEDGKMYAWSALVYDGKEITRDVYDHSVCAFGLDRLAYQMSSGGFVYGSSTYHDIPSPVGAVSFGGNLAIKDLSLGLWYNGKIIEKRSDDHIPSSPQNIGGKLAYVRTEFSPDQSNWFNWIILDGKKFGPISDDNEYIDYGGIPAYVSAEHLGGGMDGEGKEFVVANNKVVSAKYYQIRDLGVVGGKITFVGIKDESNVLVWGDKELGETEGYVDIGGVPAFEVRDVSTGMHVLMKGSEVLYRGKENEDFFVGNKTFCDINGKLAFVVYLGDRNEKDSEAYILYNGAKIFEGYKELYCYNVQGKLGVFGRDKDKNAYIYLENSLTSP